ncbi:MAG: metallophosphoesterase [Actinobacteria bacterium]|nr:metallophosphoesterase [Actinomycetota bacterium]
MMRLAAVGDIHIGRDAAGTLAPSLDRLSERCDAFLLAGDLSRRGLPEEARTLVGELEGADVPTVAVLGNHDVESGRQEEFRAILEDAGVTVLEGDSTVIETSSGRVGVAGTVGFGGGFPGATCADFGEPEMKAFVARSRRLAGSLRDALDGLGDVDRTVVLTHYAPIRETLVGEPLEIYPFLGSYHLAEVIDSAPVDLAIHGHAHHGSPEGTTPGGVPVRNVARPVIDAVYRIFEWSTAT